MKKLISSLLLPSFFLTQGFAQETGESAAAAAESVKSIEGQNWVVGLSSAVAAAIGIFVVSLQTGESGHQ